MVKNLKKIEGLSIKTPHYHCIGCGKGVAHANYSDDDLIELNGFCEECHNERNANYEVTWSIKCRKRLKAKDAEDARNIIENIDCQHDGKYVENSFEFVKVEKLEV